MTETAHTLLPCPFCGGDAHYEPGGEWQYYDTWAVECVGCAARINGSTDMRVSGAIAKADALTAWNTRAVNSHHRLIEALEKADIDLVGAEMLLQNKTINATGALADASWQPGREHIEGMRRTMEQALEEIASARAALKEAGR